MKVQIGAVKVLEVVSKLDVSSNNKVISQTGESIE